MGYFDKQFDITPLTGGEKEHFRSLLDAVSGPAPWYSWKWQAPSGSRWENDESPNVPRRGAKLLRGDDVLLARPMYAVANLIGPNTIAVLLKGAVTVYETNGPEVLELRAEFDLGPGQVPPMPDATTKELPLLTDSLTIHLWHPVTGRVESYPQPWFEPVRFDFGYEWVTIVARDPVSEHLIGAGVRIPAFELDDSNSQVLRWFDLSDKG